MALDVEFDDIAERFYLGNFTESTRLRRGLLNRVWRLRGPRGSVIAKHVQPLGVHGAASVLTVKRASQEAIVLAAFEGHGVLAPALAPGYRVPKLLAVDAAVGWLLIEDLGDGPDLEEALLEGRCTAELGAKIATFLVRLHSLTLPDSVLSGFANPGVEQVRNRTQHSQVGDWLRKAGHRDWSELEARAKETGRQIVAEQTCLVMGDLWPRSILLADGAVAFIDWELASVSTPAFDVGHFLAHLVLIEYLADSKGARELGAVFLDSYEAASSRPMDQIRDLAARHAACEILARLLGPFSEAIDWIVAGSAERRRALLKFAVKLLAPGGAERLEGYFA